MALPYSIEKAMSAVRSAGDTLSSRQRELETAKRSDDKDRALQAESAYKSAANSLESAAKTLAEAARKA
ncbi:hypothetical protein CL652_01130 [bacterium]|nr:hypothetical protein [bacterium]|tara:strand:+ start:6759 stop:6965 length:207 start_codon:yes stop_codon:yes gene_type:complete